MKNAMLSVLLLLLGLGVTWVSVAAAQADETEGGETPSEPAESADADAVEAAPVEDGPPPDAAPAEGAASEEGPAELPGAAAEPDEARAGELAAPAAEAEEEPAADSAADAETAGPEEGAGEDEPAAPEPAPWRNSFFNYTNQATFNTFCRGCQLSYNPVWQMAFSLVPRWYPGSGGFFRANLGFTLEITDTDNNALNREPLMNDLFVDYVHPFVLGEGFILMPMARVTAPLSRASLAAQRYLQAAAQLTLIKIIPEAGNLTLALLGRYGYWFSGSNVSLGPSQPDFCPPAGSFNAPAPGMVAPGDPAPTCDQFGTLTNSEHVILAGLSATMTPIGAFSINLSAFLFTTHGYGLAPGSIDVATSEAPLELADGSPSHWRNFTYFALSVAYQFTPWLNLSLGIQNSGIVAPLLDPSGGVYGPFTPNTQVFLTGTVTLDEVYNLFTGGGEEDLTPEERQRRQQGLASGPRVGGSF